MKMLLLAYPRGDPGENTPGIEHRLSELRGVSKFWRTYGWLLVYQRPAAAKMEMEAKKPSKFPEKLDPVSFLRVASRLGQFDV